MDAQLELFESGWNLVSNKQPPVKENDYTDNFESEFSQREAMPEITEESYRKLADGLLVFTIREAFGISRGGPRPSSERRNALNWLLFDDLIGDEVYPFSYINCCLATGVDPDALREQIRISLNITNN